MFDANRFGPRPEHVQLLIAEPDANIGGGLADFFSMKEYQVTHVRDGEDAFQEITDVPPYDAVLLAGRLPGRDGFQILRGARTEGVDTPIILISSLVESRNRIRGFRLGADDYVPKPFDLEELAARLRVVLRRSQQNADPPPSQGPCSVGEFTIDRTGKTLTKNGTPLPLTDLSRTVKVR